MSVSYKGSTTASKTVCQRSNRWTGAIRRKNMKKLTIKNLQINITGMREDDFFSLTDIAKQKNFEDPNGVIKTWMRRVDTLEFLFYWESMMNKDFRPVDFDGSKAKPGENAFTMSPTKWISLTNAIGIKVKLGRGDAGTYAHKDIAFEFASWISAEFKVLLIREYQRLKEEENKRLDWAGKRQLSSLNYLLQTDAIKNHIIQVDLKPQQISFVYASEADVINVALFGVTANEWKNANPNFQGNIRDNANIIELTILSNLELLNSKLIEKSFSQSDRLLLLNEEANKEKLLFTSYKPKLLQ